LTGTVLGAQLTDIKGHWAEPQITKWVDKGLIYGNSDGTFRPNNPITRAEFSALANRAFGFTASDPVTFSDVKANAWYAKDVAIAKAAGYITGYGDGTFKPMAYITRQEAAAMISRILELDAEANVEAASHFADYNTFPTWSKGYIGAVYVAGCMKGYSDNTFRAAKNITRAEAVITLDNALTIQSQPPETEPAATFDTTGVYGPVTGINTINGDVVISSAGVTLRNTIINGDLLLAKSIGDGSVTLTNVTVTGTTTIRGGGGNSVFLEDCNMPKIIVDKSGVRVVASGKTSVKLVILESGSILVEVTSGGTGFEEVIISETLPKNSKITLIGDFSDVTVEAPIELVVDSGSSIDTLTLNAAAKVSGDGKIEKAVINKSGAEIEQEPEDTKLASGVKATVGGKSVSGRSGGGGGGGSSKPAIYATKFTVHFKDGTSKEADLTSNGLRATVDLREYSNVAINRVSIEISRNGTLTATTVSWGEPPVGAEPYEDPEVDPGDGEFEITPVRTFNLSASSLNYISVSELFSGVIDDDVYLSTLRGFFGSSVSVSGTLSAGSNSENVTLTLLLSN